MKRLHHGGTEARRRTKKSADFSRRALMGMQYRPYIYKLVCVDVSVFVLIRAIRSQAFVFLRASVPSW
jgi:hypothetical protein